MTIGSLLDRALRLYWMNFGPMLGITVVAYGPVYLLMLRLETALRFDPESFGWASVAAYVAAYLLLWSCVAFPVVGGAITYAVSERYLGNPIDIRAALRRGVSCFWRVSLAECVSTCRILFGFLLLIVPGILWIASYFLIVPVILVEKLDSFSSLERSRELIRGYRAKAGAIIILSILLEGVILAGMSTAADWIAPGETGESRLLGAVLESAVSVLLMPFFGIATILLYYDMRIRKEGFDLDMLSRSFALPSAALAVAPRSRI